MRACAVALMGLAVLAVGSAHGAANIDTDGFVQDGQTTYCEGVTTAQDPLVFERLLPSSGGKCSLTVAMTASVKTFAEGDAQVQVDWAASLSSQIPAADSLFPRAVDTASGLPNDVIASLLRACKAGSNCATEQDVVVPAAVTDGDETATGPFDEQGKKPLRRYLFRFPGAGDYVIVGKVVLPGDAVLNISATEFMSFQKVHIGEGGAVLPGTVRPADTGAEAAAANKRTKESTAEVSASTPSPVGVNAQDSKGDSLTASSSSGGSQTNVIILGSIAGLGFIIAVAYFATAKKEKKTKQNDVESSIYRLTDVAKDSTTMQMPAFRPPPPSQPRRSSQQQQHSGHQSRYQQRQQAPWKAPAHTAQPMAEPVDDLPRTYPTELTSFTGDSEIGSIRSGSDLLASQMTLNSLHDSSITLQMTSFDSLHDSSVALPIRNHNHNRQRRASSASSYVDELDDSDQDEFYDADGTTSSRLFTETHGSNNNNQQQQLESFRETQNSTYSWLDSDRGTDISDLTSTIHERFTKEF